MMKVMAFIFLISFFIWTLTLSSCSSYEQFHRFSKEFEIPSKIYPADFNQSWQSVLQVMQAYDLELQNQEAGVIKTRWIDNTLALNFTDSFGRNDSVKTAKFKLIVNVAKGFRGHREVSKITVFKRQMVEHDFLQGWKVIPSDGILEKTVLYRIDRIIFIEKKLKEIEDVKNKANEKNL